MVPRASFASVIHLQAKVALIRSWTPEQFRSAAADWNELLQRSDADPLFMSWEWQWHWWRHHEAALKGELLLLAGYGEDGRLVGLAPLYLHRAGYRSLYGLRLESLGSSWRGGSDIFSEYLDFIVDRNYTAAFLSSLAEHLLADPRWSDLVVSNTKVDGVAARFVREHLHGMAYVRRSDPLDSHVAHLPASFAEYLRSLTAATRRRLWNQRKKLRSVDLRRLDAAEVPAALEQLNRFHQGRWGQAHYVGVRRAFHERFAGEMSRRHMLEMSELRCDGKPISIMYNVRAGDTEYNVQSGFDVSASRGISPGYLHFGYCVERACEEGVRNFDFLAGPGLHREYKVDFCTEQTPMITLQSIRARPLGWLYREYDRHYAPAAIATPI